ncbi:DUF1642 domain-containing protein [Enterococcus lactis]|uniref:DUF1642 domain-containing protein n=1 Tax=Enterococcus lactis TaxID=357441 RepID=UPI0039A4C2F9
MNTLDFKEGQTYICTKSDKQWWTVGKEYPAFLDSDNEPAIRDDDGDDWHSSYLSISNNQFKLKEEQPKVTLDEPQKLVVPKFVAEWFEENKDDLEFPIWELCVDSYGSKDEHGMLNWIQQSENNPIETLIRMKDGYEVEKEPLYTVTINLDRKYHLVVDEGDGNDEISTTLTTSHGVLGYRYFLTEKEIKSADENLWLIAVPVEEEEEE